MQTHICSDGTLEHVTEALDSWAVKWGASRPTPLGVVVRVKWLTWNLVSPSNGKLALLPALRVSVGRPGSHPTRAQTPHKQELRAGPLSHPGVGSCHRNMGCSPRVKTACLCQRKGTPGGPGAGGIIRRGPFHSSRSLLAGMINWTMTCPTGDLARPAPPLPRLLLPEG